MRRIDALRRRAPQPDTADRASFDDLITQGFYGPGMDRPVTTWADEHVEPIPNSFEGYARSGYKGNGVVFAVLNARMRLFTEARFQWQQMNGGRPGNLFGNQELGILEQPWTNGTTGDLLARMEQDASLAGNFYAVRMRDKLVRLRPDWVQVVITSPTDDPHDPEADVLGYRFYPGGKMGERPRTFTPAEVVHYAPIPDPEARCRGMSWLAPIVREVEADSGYTLHKSRFVDNAATPNLAVTMPGITEKKDFLEMVEEMDKRHKGAANAYKTLWTMGGADVTVIGADMKQMDFAVTQAAGESRVAAAGGVPPIVVGLREGLQAATYSNYGQARRAFSDLWARPQWRSAAEALQSVLTVPAGSRLWYDDRHVAYLQEDQRDDAEIKGKDAQTIRTLIDAGFLADSVTAAVETGDMTALKHSGLFSVQLQKPGEGGAAAPTTPTPEEPSSE